MAGKIVNFLNRRWINQLNELNNRRPFLTKDEFVESLSYKGYDLNTINVVYDSLMNYLPQVESISLHPNDNVIEDYHIDDEDLADMIIDKCFKKLGGKMPSIPLQETFFEKNDNSPTVENIIRFVDFFKNH